MKVRALVFLLLIVALPSRELTAATSPVKEAPAVVSHPVILRPVDLDVRITMTAPEVRQLEDAPSPESYRAPGVTGLYDQLRAEARRKPPRGSSLRKLAPYQPYEARVTPPASNIYNIRQIVIKFVEGSAIRLRDGKLQRVKDAAATRNANRLGRRGLEPQNVIDDLGALGKILTGARAKVGRAAPQVSEEDLNLLRDAAESRSTSEMPELNLFYFVHLPPMDPESTAKVLASIKALRSIEVAYFQPIPFDAADIPPVTTIDVTPSQGYFMGTPAGIDVNFARFFTGGRGNTMRIADIESGWHINHEDHPPPLFGYGINWSHQYGNHGAAVLGELIAEENGFGGNGIAPNAQYGWSSVTNFDPFNLYFYSVANALLTAAQALRPGDVALIEQQFEHLFEGVICTPGADPCGNCALPHYVATEEFAHEHAAYWHMTAVGLVVVEAAGNGRTLVTPASTVDSGAIVVGASNQNLAPMCWSNFGPRVDVHAWGRGVGTSGYGDLQANGNDSSQWYTSGFSGTSSASPIVTGAAVLIQSTRLVEGQPLLTSVEMRDLLKATGTPQAPVAAGATLRNIGPLPDLRRAIATYIPDRARFVNQSPSSGPATVAPGQVFSRTVTFANRGGISWTGGHTMAIAPQPGGGTGFTALPFPIASPTSPINPGQSVTRTFNIASPTAPGTYNLTSVFRNAGGNVMATSPTEQIIVRTVANTFDNASITILSAPSSLTSGMSGGVTAFVLNTGTTTWTVPGFSLRLQRGLKVTLPSNTVAMPPLAPGQGLSIFFVVGCHPTAPGQGYFSAQMGGTNGAFGQIASRTVVCLAPP